MLRLRSPHSRRLWRAAWSGDEQRFRSKFDGAESRRDLILEVDPTSGWSAPHFAAVYDRVGMLTEMLDECPDLVEMPNRQGWRPLHFASGFGRRDVIDLLLARGARLDTRNEVSTEYRGWTPLHRAFRWWLDPNKPNAISHLLLRGADATALDASGRTPVDLVASSCCRDATRLLAEAASAGHETANVSLQSEQTQQRLREGE